MPEFTVDGRVLEFEPGQTIMQAAHSAGVYIPHLCYHPDFAVHGSCRVCLVRVDGRFLSACTLPVVEGMVVENQSDVVQSYRRQLLEMLFTEGNHLCPSCEKSGACTLQSVAIFCGMLSPRLEFRYPKRPVDASHGDFVLDYNRCINCELCVRASRDVDKKSVFSMAGRGRDSHLRVNSCDGSLGQSELRLADRAADICPVGAILPKHRGFSVAIGQRRFDLRAVDKEWETSDESA